MLKMSIFQPSTVTIFQPSTARPLKSILKVRKTVGWCENRQEIYPDGKIKYVKILILILIILILITRLFNEQAPKNGTLE